MYWKLGTIHEHVLLSAMAMHIYESENLIFLLAGQIRFLVFDQLLDRTNNRVELWMR